MISFTVSPEGITRLGVPLRRLLDEVKPHRELFDGIGLNCGCGPAHILKFARDLLSYSRQYLSLPVLVMPNADIPRWKKTVRCSIPLRSIFLIRL